LIQGSKNFYKTHQHHFFSIFAVAQVARAHREHQARKPLVEQLLGAAVTLAASSYEVGVSHRKERVEKDNSRAFGGVDATFAVAVASGMLFF
jgi:hypothetical protein